MSPSFAYAQQGEIWGRERWQGGEVRGETGAEREAPWGIASEAKDMKHIPSGVGEAGADEQREAWSLS